MIFHIHKLGPVIQADYELKDFTVFTGYQSSGKSTIAKTVYLFRTVKDTIYDYFTERKYLNIYKGKVSGDQQTVSDIRNLIKQKFLGVFGSSEQMDADMRIRCDYTGNTYIEINLKNSIIPNDVNVVFCQSILEALKEYRKSDYSEEMLAAHLRELFNDPYTTVYIPSGRNMITVLGDQYALFYSRLTDDGKRRIDTCTMDYLNLILQIRARFAGGLKGVERDYLQMFSEEEPGEQERRIKLYHLAEDLSSRILSGSYYVDSGEEKIRLPGGGFVRVNYASSGQQEAVWILNILFYCMFRQRTMFIVEEPESHLFPDTQRLITEYISLVQRQGNQVFVTTHSPYILGTADVLLYAGNLEKRYPERADQIHQVIREEYELDISSTSAFFVEMGTVKDIIDKDLGEIDQDRLDQVSGQLNEIYNRLASIENEAAE